MSVTIAAAVVGGSLALLILVLAAVDRAFRRGYSRGFAAGEKYGLRH